MISSAINKPEDYPESPFGSAARVTWAEAGEAPLCLLARDMQSRPIVDSVVRRIGIEPVPLLETDWLSALLAHVRLGHWPASCPIRRWNRWNWRTVCAPFRSSSRMFLTL